MAALSRTLYSVARAAWKASAARVRSVGGLPVHPHWAERAKVCARCPMSVVECGAMYCGRPFKRQPVRDVIVDGCGCPTLAKAKDPAEHCPLTSDHVAAGGGNNECNCKWCVHLATI